MKLIKFIDVSHVYVDPVSSYTVKEYYLNNELASRITSVTIGSGVIGSATIYGVFTPQSSLS